MRLVVNAKRWDEPIDSNSFMPEGYREIRLVQHDNGNIIVYVNGSTEPATSVEPHYHGGGERLWVFGDREDVKPNEME